ncbi:spore coat protein [Oceanobacillus piezotolerans]|uniref:Spore coat protein n=1 Tax=Oceanobacillus piezotolerans TaxID=2448030 RepID=A0A498DGD7_9BACI|nr:CotD family spore coat protein [Oceanobacillus piezotolerans]RLL43702.1 spore coat protein [Oceanobacillus piezotolerans]
MRRRHHGPHCGCPICIVHPTMVNNVHTCSESTVKQVHPSHTNVINHHLVKNVHTFPHSTSFENVTNSVDIMGPSYEVPTPPGQVAGVMSPGFGPGGMGPGFGPGYGPGAMGPGFGPGQVAGAMTPGYGPGGMGPGFGPGQVAGAMQPGYGKHWNKPHKW